MPTIAIVDGILILLYFNDTRRHIFMPKAPIFMPEFESKTER
jgi:hypothetical protein